MEESGLEPRSGQLQSAKGVLGSQGKRLPESMSFGLEPLINLWRRFNFHWNKFSLMNINVPTLRLTIWLTKALSKSPVRMSWFYEPVSVVGVGKGCQEWRLILQSWPVCNGDEDTHLSFPTYSGPNSMCVHSLALQGRKWKYMSKRKPCHNCSMPASKQVLRVVLYKERLHWCECHILFPLALTKKNFFFKDQSVLYEYAMFDIGQSTLFQNRHFPKT